MVNAESPSTRRDRAQATATPMRSRPPRSLSDRAILQSILVKRAQKQWLICIEHGQKTLAAANPGFNACRYRAQCGRTIGHSMRFLLRMLIWLTIILALLPSGGSKAPPRRNVSATDAISAATATVTDMRSFCDRQPEACSVGSRAAVAIGHRAEAGAKMAYKYLHEHFGVYEAGAPLSDTSAEAVPLPAPRPLQHTLSPPDPAPSSLSPHRPSQVRGDGLRGDGPA